MNEQQPAQHAEFMGYDDEGMAVYRLPFDL